MFTSKFEMLLNMPVNQINEKSTIKLEMLFQLCYTYLWFKNNKNIGTALYLIVTKIECFSDTTILFFI